MKMLLSSSPVYGPGTATRAHTQRPPDILKTGFNRRTMLAPVRAAGDDVDDFMNPFFYGKALAEVLNERLGNVAADTLAFVGTAEAELRKAFDEIQEEVVERAQQEIGMQNGSTNGSSPPRIGGNGASGRSGRAIAARTGAAAALDEDEIVDNLRAEIASTRSLIQQTKASMSSKTK
jgi:hypothetical protein